MNTGKSSIATVEDDECCKFGYPDACNIVLEVVPEDVAEIDTEVIIEDESDDE